LTPQQIASLEEAFFWGANDTQAYTHAGICKSTFYYWQEVNPDFVEKKAGMQENIKLRAKRVLVESIVGGDVNSAKFWLERKSKDEFSLRNEITGANGNPERVVYVEKAETEGYNQHIDEVLNSNKDGD